MMGRLALRAPLCCLLALAAPQARAAAPSWDRFTAILWHSDLPPAALAALPGVGITAGRVFGQRGTMDPAALRASLAAQRRAGLDTMVENIATDFYAAYHRYVPGQPINAAFLELLARYHAYPDDPAVWRREPGLADPAAFAPIAARLTAHAASLAAAPALYLSLGDETGIADLSAASDLDQGEAMLQQWRAALRQRYGTIGALNQAWHAEVPDWQALLPTSTDAALDGTGPIAGWLDFKAWMDGAYARAVRRGTEAVHAGDPAARAAIEGSQRPGWGGYDYATLAQAVDVLEAGEPDPAFGLARSFNPAVILITTVEPAKVDANRLWHSLLLGGRGTVLWDEDGGVMRPDGTPGPGGAALAPVLADLRGPLGTTLMAARPQPSGVAVLYSQASFQMRWLLDRRVERQAGQDWTTRDNDVDLADSPWRTALAAGAAALDHVGLHADYLDAATLTPPRLAGLRAVLLPHAIVLGDDAVAALRQFAAQGGTILADVEPGSYDALGNARPAPPLAGLGARLGTFDPAALRRALSEAAPVTTPSGAPRDDVGVFRFADGTMTAIQPDDARGAGPAMASIGRWRCAVVLDPVVPVVLAAAPDGVVTVTPDGARHGTTCSATPGGEQ